MYSETRHELFCVILVVWKVILSVLFVSHLLSFGVLFCCKPKCLSSLKYLDNLNQIHSIRSLSFANWWHKIFWKPWSHIRELAYNVALRHREVKSISLLNGVTSASLSRKFYSPPLFIKMNSLTFIIYI